MKDIAFDCAIEQLEAAIEKRIQMEHDYAKVIYKIDRMQWFIQGIIAGFGVATLLFIIYIL